MARKPKADPPKPDEPAPPPPDKPARKTAPVQIDTELAHIAVTIAAHDDVTVGELLSSFLRPFLLQEYERVQKQIAARLKRMTGEAD